MASVSRFSYRIFCGPVLGSCLIILFLQLQALPKVISLDPPERNLLFEGDTSSRITDFYRYCTNASKIPCHLSTPEDFKNLHGAKSHMVSALKYYRSPLRLLLQLTLVGAIIVLMIHLTLVRHFNYRFLPLINLCFDRGHGHAKTDGIRYQQYIWMKYMVLRGNHYAFQGRDYRTINWHVYQQQAKDFNYKSVPITRFKFLDKKNLTKHLMMVEEVEKETVELLHGLGH